MKKHLIILFLLANKLCFSQVTKSDMRPPFELKLFVNDTTFYSAPMQTTYYVTPNNMVQIFPGETLYIEAEILKDSLVNLKAVPAIVNKDRTMTITFEQVHTGKVHEQMILSVKNPFIKHLVYKAFMHLMVQKRWVETDVLPVFPNIAGKEMWGDVITTMTLTGFYLKDKVN
jgi:hypothetical protein